MLALMPAGSIAQGTEIETYEGRIQSSDVSFKLHIFEAGRATAEWEKSSGAAVKYNGTYTGSEGNYAIKLDPISDASAGKLTLSLKSLGGMTNGTFLAGSGSSRKITELKLTGVSTPTGGLRGAQKNKARTRQGGQNNQRNRNQRTNNQRSRNNSGNRNGGSGRAGNRNRRTVVVPGIGNPIRP
jgi:hypothetical protein